MTLSNVDRLARVFEDEIDDTNGTATNYDPYDFFGSVSSRIRFGSTGSNEPAASNISDTGLFARTPDRTPRGDDILLRGTGTFRGDTVAVVEAPSGATAATASKLYVGKIELTASFSKTQVTCAITELMDEDGALSRP